MSGIDGKEGLNIVNPNFNVERDPKRIQDSMVMDAVISRIHRQLSNYLKQSEKDLTTGGHQDPTKVENYKDIPYIIKAEGEADIDKINPKIVLDSDSRVHEVVESPEVQGKIQELVGSIAKIIKSQKYEGRRS